VSCLFCISGALCEIATLPRRRPRVAHVRESALLIGTGALEGGQGTKGKTEKTGQKRTRVLEIREGGRRRARRGKPGGWTELSKVLWRVGVMRPVRAINAGRAFLRRSVVWHMGVCSAGPSASAAAAAAEMPAARRRSCIASRRRRAQLCLRGGASARTMSFVTARGRWYLGSEERCRKERGAVHGCSRRAHGDGRQRGCPGAIAVAAAPARVAWELCGRPRVPAHRLKAVEAVRSLARSHVATHTRLAATGTMRHCVGTRWPRTRKRRRLHRLGAWASAKIHRSRLPMRRSPSDI
jgi:hypothetical protein